MEDFFDNFLYIIITIAVLAFSMLNKKKKAEEAQRSTSRAPGERPATVFNPFEEVMSTEEDLDEDSEEYENLAPIPSIFNNPKHSGQPSNEAFNPEVKSAFEPKAEKRASLKDQSSAVEAGMIIDMKYDWDDQTERRDKPEGIDFDLRSAVIQAEILNRKYP